MKDGNEGEIGSEEDSVECVFIENSLENTIEIGGVLLRRGFNLINLSPFALFCNQKSNHPDKCRHHNKKSQTYIKIRQHILT